MTHALTSFPTPQKMWPPVKKKAIENHPSFAAFLGNAGANIAAPSADTKAAPAAKATGGRKRKAEVADEAEADAETKDLDPKSAGVKSESAGAKSDKSDGNKSDSKAAKPETKKKATAAKGKPHAKKAKKEELSDENITGEDDADAAGKNVPSNLLHYRSAILKMIQRQSKRLKRKSRCFVISHAGLVVD